MKGNGSSESTNLSFEYDPEFDYFDYTDMTCEDFILDSYRKEFKVGRMMDFDCKGIFPKYDFPTEQVNIQPRNQLFNTHCSVGESYYATIQLMNIKLFIDDTTLVSIKYIHI